jgi:hypothetical protein
MIEVKPLPSGKRFSAFGLSFESDLDLPELTPTSTHPDVSIRLRAVEHDRPITRTTYIYGETCFLFWPEVGGYMLHGGEAVDIDPVPGVSDGLLRLPLLGPVMALLLHARGALVMHASAVRIGARVGVFIGDKGAGKSTTLASALTRGHGLYTDDVLAISLDKNGVPLAPPGFPTVKLSDEGAQHLAMNQMEALPEPIASFPKRICRLREGFSETPAPLGRFYVLARGETAQLERLDAAHGLQALMRYAYVPLFRGRPWARAETQTFFTQCAHLAAAIGVARLTTPNRVERIEDALALVEHDLARD